MIGNFTEVKPLRYWVQHILPLVYDDSLSYMELLGKVVNTLNEVVKNNNLLPDYIMELIKEYISSGEIEKVLAEVLSNYMLNVKFPPSGLKPATGDGSADDTEAIQGCIDYAYNNGGMSVYFPSGSYLTQPLTLRNKATLFGQDRYTTRLVMKGGATTAMFTGEVDELTLTGLGFDGNMDIQVNNVNLFTISVNSAIITNCLLTDGYDLLNITVNDDLQLNDVIFRHAVENALVLKGAGIVQGNNLIFKSVSTLVGKNFVVMDVSKSILEQLKCYGASPNAVLINGSNNVVKMWNEQSLKAYTDNGVNNTVEVYAQSEQKNLTGFKTTNVNGDITETVGGNVTESITGNKSVTAHDITETANGNRDETTAGNATENVLGDKVSNAKNSTETVTEEKDFNANVSRETLVTKTVNVKGLSTENLNSKNEAITGDKVVRVANSVEIVQGDKTVTAGDISNTAENITNHATQNLTEQIDGNRAVTVKGNDIETITGKKTVNSGEFDMNPSSPMQYKNTTPLNDMFSTVPMKDRSNSQYDLLVKTPKTADIYNKLIDGETDFRTMETLLGKTIYNKLKDGAKVCCFGDSLMSGIGWNGGSANQTPQNDGIAAILRQIFPNSTITNLAITAKTFHNRTNNSIIAQLANIPSDTEIIFFDGGINDVKEQCRTFNDQDINVIGLPNLRTFNDSYDQTTAFGALNHILYWLKTNRPNADVTYCLYNTIFADLAGRYDLFKYCADMYTTICKTWGVRVFQFGKHIPSYEVNASYYNDAVHYNEKGYTHLAYEFVKFLLTDRNENDVHFEFVCTWATFTGNFVNNAFVGVYSDIAKELNIIFEKFDFSGTFIASEIKIARNVLTTMDHYRLGSCLIRFCNTNANANSRSSDMLYYNSNYIKSYESTAIYLFGYTALNQIVAPGTFYIPISEVDNYTDLPDSLKDNGVVIVENYPMERGLGVMKLSTYYGHSVLGHVNYGYSFTATQSNYPMSELLYSKDIAAVYCNANQWTTVANLTLPPGTYVLNAYTSVTGVDANGAMRLQSDIENITNGFNIKLNGEALMGFPSVNGVLQLTEQTTILCQIYTSSAFTNNATGTLKAVRIR